MGIESAAAIAGGGRVVANAMASSVHEVDRCTKAVLLSRGPVPGPGTNYTGPREILLEFVILVF